MVSVFRGCFFLGLTAEAWAVFCEGNIFWTNHNHIPTLTSRMSAPPVNIRISGRNDFICPVGKTVEQVEGRIRSMFVLNGGGIEKNGVSMFPDDIITNGDDEYHFVNFQGM
jgi:hypothetical protein